MVPAEEGRLIDATHDDARHRGAVFMPDGKSIIALSDASGEYEFTKISAKGDKPLEQITKNSSLFQFEGDISPDGKSIAYSDKNEKLWVVDLESGHQQFVDSSLGWGIYGYEWSPDSRWLAYTISEENLMMRIFIYDTESTKSYAATTQRFYDYSPAWSPDGKWLYFLSDRNFVSLSGSPWQSQQPFPYLDKKAQIFMLALTEGLISPFEPENEVTAAAEEEEEEEESSDDSGDEKTVTLAIEVDGLNDRIFVTPVPAGNYTSLSATESQIYWLSRAAGSQGQSLQTIEIKNDDPEVVDLTGGVKNYELSSDGKKIFIRKKNTIYVADAGASELSSLGDNQVDLSGWALSLDPRREWRQMFIDAWRMERDYFYDPGTHGVDWEAVRDKYLPLVDRITDRGELSDLLREMVGELTALHVYVGGGDYREGPDEISSASLGALLTRDEKNSGYRVDHIYHHDPDRPELAGPLSRPGVNVNEGDVIVKVNNRPVLESIQIGALLRNQIGKQVLLSVKPKGSSDTRDVIVEPIGTFAARNLRYHEWEYTRRLIVEDKSDGNFGYVHMRSTGGRDYADWVRGFYPALNKSGLVIDYRNNGGGNIDSWILTALMRKPWAYWQSRSGVPYPNMQGSFRGHIVVLVNEATSSDGELFAEGIRRLGLGKSIGIRTWGGEIWLSYSNFLVDRGIASSAESGVFGPEGQWLIENWGFEPDMVVENLPHATFNGEDAQLQAAIDYLKEQNKLNPIEPIKAPPYPDKSLKPGK